MIEISHKTSTTLAVSNAYRLRFYQLPEIVSPALAQTGACIRAVDVGLEGYSIEYDTDQGRIRLDYARGESGSRELTIACDTTRRGSRETGRQICFHLARRLISRYPIAAIYWRPTRQHLQPENFTWGALADLPQRFGSRQILNLGDAPSAAWA